ncbi:hypothetical protein [Sphingomonas sp. 22176]|uniref:hypothetical protein n=1 Tax=Sphingomonas sp. 22176 TaxID=3453884 RepID=UPI003F878B51
MRVIVPLAGPDFEIGANQTRADRIVEGQPLLRRALESRSWWRAGTVGAADMVFVLRDTHVSRAFAEQRLATWYPGAQHIFLGAYTSGAVLTTLCGVALADAGAPICVDLADILFDGDVDPVAAFADPRMGGLLLTFPSSNAAYSYAELDAQGNVLRTAEKKVISSHASAGVYFFRDAPTLLRAIAHSLSHRDALAYNGLLFVCPLYNGVLAEGSAVKVAAVQNVRDIKMTA